MQSVFELILPFALILTALSFILIMRYFIHRERMAAIARGLIPPGVTAKATPISIWLFRSGIITVMGGLAVLLGLWLGLGRGPWLLGGLVPTGLGMGLVLCHWLVEGDDTTARGSDRGRNPSLPQERDH